MKATAKWISVNCWVCLKHFIPPKMHMSEGKCVESTCSVVRPRRTAEEVYKFGEIKSVQKTPSVTESDLCAWEKCTKMAGYRGLKRPSSKYCSDACRKSKARDSYRRKKKLN